MLTSCQQKEDFKSDSTTIELIGNISTGYSWSFTTTDESIVNVSKAAKPVGDRLMIGGSSRYIYTLNSVNPGSSVMTFKYCRPWKPDNPQKIISYKIDVLKNGKITIEQIES